MGCRHLGIMALALVLIIGLVSPTWAGDGPVPGWSKGGTDSAGYAIGTEPTEQGQAAYIRSLDPRPGLYGMIYQAIMAEPYLGRRYRLSARIRTEDVAMLASMWMRVDRDKTIVAFDNMTGRPIVGTTDWQDYAIVLDVPAGSDTILFGLALSGEGKALWDDVRFEEVGPDVPLTGFVEAPRPSGPVNLDFD